MSRAPDHFAARRARQRSQLRRRRLMALAAAVAVVAVVAVLITQLGGGNVQRSAASVTSASPGAAGGGRPHDRHAAGSGSARQATASAEIARLVSLGLPIYCAGPRGNAVAFTFDDGPGPYTHYALKKLRESGERATFFVVGRSMDNFPGEVQRELPFATIGDHTYTHPELTALSTSAANDEIARTARKVEQATGQKVELFRPPYGLHNAVVDAIAKRLGLLEILWSIDSADSLGANWAGIIQNVETHLKPGSIVLMHENRGQTIRALTTLLPYLHSHHLHSVTVPELLASDPPSVAQVRRGGLGCGGPASARSGS